MAVYKPKRPLRDTIEINPDGTTTSVKSIKKCDKNESKISDPNFIMRLHGYNPENWELLSARNSVYEMQLKGGAVDTFYASKITVKPKEVATITPEEIVKELQKFERSRRSNPLKPKEVKKSKKGKLLEVPPMDLHLGKLAFDYETGQSFNSDIAEKAFDRYIESVVSEYQNTKIDKVLLVLGNDFFNFDTPSRTTTAGTPQDSAETLKVLFKRGIGMWIRAVESLKQLANVDVMVIPGNHDEYQCFYGLMSLEAWFKDDTEVNVIDSVRKRQYYRFGNSLIGFTHGDEARNLRSNMAEEADKDYAATKYHEFHLGHLHTEKVLPYNEEGGFITRYVSSITGPDNWHDSKGFVGNIQKFQTFLWDYQYGLENIRNHTIDFLMNKRK